MADLNRDRGQIILVTGFVLAATFVALALILNSVIFTENLATRSEAVGGPGPIETRDIVGDGVGDLMAFANANNGSDEDEQLEEIRNATEALGPALGRQFGLRGQSVNVTYIDERNGTRLVHNDSSREFTSNDTDENWTVVNGTALNESGDSVEVDRIRDFGFNVTRTELAPASDCPFGDCFRANVTASGTNLPAWGVALYEDGTGVNATSYRYNSTGRTVIGTCRIPGDNVQVSLSTGRVGNASAIPVEDSECQAIEFASGISPPYNVTYHNGDEAEGTYSLITSRNRNLSSLPSDLFDSPDSGGSPRATHAIYNVSVRTTYVVDSVDYNATVRVAPGEP